MKQNVRKLTLGAMMVAIISLFLVINLQTAGLLEVYMIWILPLPIIFYYVHYGFKATLTVVVSSLLLSFMLGSWITVFYTLTALLVGLVYGYGVYHQKDNAYLVISTTIVSAISLFIEMYALAAFFGYDLAAETKEIIALLNSMDGLVIPNDLESLVYAIYPIALLLMAFLQSLVTHLFALYLLKRLKIQTRKMKSLNEYRLPTWAGILSLLGLFSAILLAFNNEGMMRQYAMMAITLSTVVLIVDAYIVIILYARSQKLRWLPLVSSLGLLFLPSLSIYLFIGLGLLDSLTDFRARFITRGKNV
jgi:uncharacterized protein YybS (DUF2232 family)